MVRKKAKIDVTSMVSSHQLVWLREQGLGVHRFIQVSSVADSLQVFSHLDGKYAMEKEKLQLGSAQLWAEIKSRVDLNIRRRLLVGVL